MLRNLLFIMMVLPYISHMATSQEYIHTSYMNFFPASNPAVPGIGEDSRLSMHYHSSLFSGQSIYSNFNVSYTSFLERYQSGLGIHIMNDRQGGGKINHLSLNLQYAYRIVLRPQYYLIGGIQASLIQRSLNTEDLILPSMINPNTGELQENNALASYDKYIPDFSVGFAAVLLNQQIGFTINHLTEPYLSDQKENRLSRKYAISWFKNFKIEKRGLLDELIILTPSIRYEYFNQHFIIPGMNLRIQDLMIGVKLNQPLQMHLHSADFLLGYFLESYGFFYGYEFFFPRNNYGFVNSGSHKVTFFYNFRYNE